ncbi:mitotic spindle and nuclear protein isoform 2-T2 [Cochliomyia hominivorax]
MASTDNTEIKKSTRRSKKVKNLEEEVEIIFSQDESDEDINTKENKKEEFLHKTPSRRNAIKESTTPSATQTVLQEMLQTPRRSCRKSIKPTQDYDDIINKSLRSCTRSAKKNLLVTEEQDEEENEENHIGEIVQPKWTPAKVGRVSQKRSRKSKRKVKKIEESKPQDEEVENLDNEIYVKESFVENVMKEEDTKHEKGNKVEELFVDGTSRKKTIKEEYMSKNIDYKVEDLSKEEEKDVDLEDIKIEENEEKENVIIINESNKSEEYIQNNVYISDPEYFEDEPLHLIQEDTEDCKQYEEKSKEEDICIIYEHNISNNEIKKNNGSCSETSGPDKNEPNKTLDDSFGCYLKSKDINISDLGLNPLKDEENDKNEDVREVEDKDINPSVQETEEMPSLIVCDDDEDDILINDKSSSNKLNETFETNDTSNIPEKSIANSIKQSDETMEILQMSDDEDNEVPNKRPHVESQNQSILSSPKGSVIKTKLPSTPKGLTTPNLPSTPKQSGKAFRFPTPYRSRNNFKFNNEVKENVPRKTPNKNLCNTSMISVTNMEPKEIVLRGIRKRSLSVCIDGNESNRQKFLAGPLAKLKQDRVVSFYSPANQTTIIDDIDMQIAKSLKKQKPVDNNKFVTTRRKRSISFDDSIMSTSHISKLPRPVVNQNTTNKQQNSSTISKPIARTKLPNFAAIHEKQFKKMENLVDHISRKQERSKNLINSATKLKPVKKNISINKNNNNIVNEKSKALKKIDLGVSSTLNNTISTTTATTNRINEQVTSTKLVNNLPDPRLGVVNPVKPGTISRRQPQQQQLINKYLKPSQTSNIEKTRPNSNKTVPAKPGFNLSTSLMVKPTTSSATSFTEKANTSCMINNEDKMASRLQRHMDLFKGRCPSTRAGVASRKNEVLLKGVRSNRRFELQMQHRKNMEQ